MVIKNRLFFPHPFQHQRQAEKRGARVGDALAGDVRRRTVGGLEQRRLRRVRRVQVGGRRHPEPAGQHRRQIGENVAVQVAGHHHVEAPRRLHEFHRRRVHQLVVGGHVRVVGGHFLEHPVVEGAPERLGVAFGDQAHLRFTGLAVGAVEAAWAVRSSPFGGTLPGAFEGVAYQPLGGGVGEHLQLRGDFLTGVRA